MLPLVSHKTKQIIRGCMIAVAFLCIDGAAACPTWCMGTNCGSRHDLVCCTEAASVCSSCTYCATPVPTEVAPTQTAAAAAPRGSTVPADGKHTAVSIVSDEWYINGEPTFKGRKWEGVSMQGLLPNSRMVNAIFDDEHTSTQHLWSYPDTGKCMH